MVSSWWGDQSVKLIKAEERAFLACFGISDLGVRRRFEEKERILQGTFSGNIARKFDGRSDGTLEVPV